MVVSRSLAMSVSLVLLVACRSQPGGATATGAAASGAAGTNASADSTGAVSGTTTAYIQDPTLNNMTAIDVTVPAKWHFQGSLIQGDSCSAVPYVVYRATSPDGLTFVENMPTLHWVFGSGPVSATQLHGCLPLQRQLTAQQFLHYFATMMKYDYAGDEAVPADVSAAAQQANHQAQAQYAPQYAAIGAQQPQQTLTLARARVTFANGSFPMQGQLSAKILCTVQQFAGFRSTLPGMASQANSVVENCGAEVRFISTTAAQYAKVTALMDADKVGYTPDPGWMQAYVNRSNQQALQRGQQIMAAGAAQRAATAQYWAQARAVSTQMHNQFMASMQSQFNNFEAGQAAQQASRAQFSSDMVDFALDQQTVADPNSGQLSKVSNFYGQTWVDSSGKTSFQTNDVNANPNGVLPGTWAQQQVVHGNGTAY
jgi:hypothetical protein